MIQIPDHLEAWKCRSSHCQRKQSLALEQQAWSKHDVMLEVVRGPVSPTQWAREQSYPQITHIYFILDKRVFLGVSCPLVLGQKVTCTVNTKVRVFWEAFNSQGSKETFIHTSTVSPYTHVYTSLCTLIHRWKEATVRHSPCDNEVKNSHCCHWLAAILRE